MSQLNQIYILQNVTAKKKNNKLNFLIKLNSILKQCMSVVTITLYSYIHTLLNG